VAPADILSTFEAKPTALDGVSISEGLEEIGKVLDRGTLIRSHVLADLGKILHTKHQYHWHTGYAPPQSVAAPHMGAWIAREMGPRNPVVPPFTVIGQRFNIVEKEELKAFHSAGFFGSDFGPFIIEDPTAALDTVRPPAGMTPERFTARQALYREMLKTSGFAEKAGDFQQEALLRSMEQAYALLRSPEAAAFDLKLEPKESYDAYNTGRFGQGCLLARRLVEGGVRCVEVEMNGWDMHRDLWDELPEKAGELDAALAALVEDLEARGLLASTLVVLATEFGRTPKINENAGRDHHPGVFSCVLAGAGVKRGVVHGASDAGGRSPDRDAVSVGDFNATVAAACGLPWDREFVAPNGRPFKIGNEGRPIAAVLA
jgi:hypothetical protein